MQLRCNRNVLKIGHYPLTLGASAIPWAEVEILDGPVSDDRTLQERGTTRLTPRVPLLIRDAIVFVYLSL